MPDLLVSTDWLAAHLDDPRVRIVQSDLSPDGFQCGHIPGAVFWALSPDVFNLGWSLDLDSTHLHELLARSGISSDSIVVFASDAPPIMTCLWRFMQIIGHADARVLDGGTGKWRAENRPLSTDDPPVSPSNAHVSDFDLSSRAVVDDVRGAQSDENAVLLDVRTPQEWSGQWFFTAPPENGERAGHIPGALHVPFEIALGDDGTFKSRDELRALYEERGVTGDKTIITYCTIGARSTLTFFVLKHLLGFPDVLNYDGSWSEWSRLGEFDAAR